MREVLSQVLPEGNIDMTDLIKVRLDKWLWAARFFKTRAISRKAIDGGKIHVNGRRGRPARDVKLEDELKIRQGWHEKTIIVKGVSEHRRGAPEAEQLYCETAQSIEARQLSRVQSKAAGQHLATAGRPSKKNRRLIHQFKDRNR